jgi:hypothetical protein
VSSLGDRHQIDLDQEVRVGNGIALVMKSAPAGHTGSTSSVSCNYVFAGVTGAALGLAHLAFACKWPEPNHLM